MNSVSDEAKSRHHQGVKIQIVTREVFFEKACGSHSYLLSLLRYFKQIGFQITLLLLDSSTADSRPIFVIPASVRGLSHVSARDCLRVRRLLVRFRFFSDWLLGPIWLLYSLMPQVLKNTIYLRSCRRALDTIHSILGNLFSGANHGVKPWDALATSEEKAFFKRQFVRHRPNVVIVNYAFLGDVLSVIPSSESVLKVIITHDILHQRVTQFKKRNPDLLDVSDWDIEKESEQLRKAQLLLAIQEDDAKVLKKTAMPCEVLCMPMSANYLPCLVDQIRGRCLFVGSCAGHNIHGFSWFLENVWPVVLQLVPYASLHVCGPVSGSIHRTFQNVTLLGRVDDLRPEYGAAEVCLVPLIIGTGLKIKLVEALAHGRACVSTPLGAQGISELTDKALIVAETAGDFARAIQTILTNSTKRLSMEAQARKFVRERLSPNTVYQPFVDRIYRHLRDTRKYPTDNTLSGLNRG